MGPWLTVRPRMVAAGIVLTAIAMFAALAGDDGQPSALAASGGVDGLAPSMPAAPGKARVFVTFVADFDRDGDLTDEDEEEEKQESLLRAYGGSVRHRYELVDAVAIEVDEDALEELADDPRVVRVEPDHRVFPDLTPNDPLYATYLWGLNNTGQTGGTPDADIDAPEAWNVTTGSSNTLIAVIDTGADINHPDLAANI